MQAMKPRLRWKSFVLRIKEGITNDVKWLVNIKIVLMAEWIFWLVYKNKKYDMDISIVTFLKGFKKI